MVKGIAIALAANLLVVGGLSMVLEAAVGDTHIDLVAYAVIGATAISLMLWNLRHSPKRSRRWWDYF